MTDRPIYKGNDAIAIVKGYRSILVALGNPDRDSVKRIRLAFETALRNSNYDANRETHHPILRTINIALIVAGEIGLGRTSVICALLYDAVRNNKIPEDVILKTYGQGVADILNGLVKASELYARSAAIESENFRKLLLTFSRDMRVILIIIADRLETLRNLELYSSEDQDKISRESAYLYAPLAHRLGLYAIKSQMEDLSLKYNNRTLYKDIAKRLNETKRDRDLYIAEFIAPIRAQLEKEGFTFEIKGRTKTIYSIWNKIKKKDTPFEEIMDLFAIRIILETEPASEKADCWRVYSLITDKYLPDPERLRDWLSIPKSNGYESLHTTVMGPKGKWVEVQIRTRRMDEIAEKGLAAHWKYKGGKSEGGVDNWLQQIREILENPERNAIDFMSDFKLGLYDKEVYVFTPKGDLRRMPQGATVLDFAFDIHSGVGSKCVGAKVNGKNVTLRYVLKNGEQLEILTSSQQKPKLEWLKIATTSKARTKIKQALKEQDYKDAEFGRETLVRRFKNWKMNLDDGRLQKLVKQMKYPTSTDFYCAIANSLLDVQKVREAYVALEKSELEAVTDTMQTKSAEDFTVLHNSKVTSESDILTIDNFLKGIDYTFAKCCNPIYGDEVFGFVGSMGGVKIHRKNCPNAPQMFTRFGYRIVPAQWSGKASGEFEVTLHITGNDSLSVISNISSVLKQESRVELRNVSINSNDGVFQGTIMLAVKDTSQLEGIIRVLRTVKGVISVSRIDR